MAPVSRADLRREDPSLAFEEIEVPTPAAVGPFLNAALRPSSLIAEQFRVLGAQVGALNTAAPLRCLGVVSCLPGEGKTTISLGLSMALSRDVGAKVLLIEADLRRPTVEQYLGLRPIAGLGEWLTGSATTVEMRRLGTSGLSLLAAGQHIAQRSDLLHSPRMRQILVAARQLFNYVILDCPPLTPIADSHLIQDFLDGFLLVVRARTASRDMLLRSISYLKPGRLRGVVFNDHRQILSAYHRYGYGYAELDRRPRNEPGDPEPGSDSPTDQTLT